MTAERLLTVEEAARRLRVARVTVLRWIRGGKLEASKPGLKYLIRETAVDELLEKTRGSAER